MTLPLFDKKPDPDPCNRRHAEDLRRETFAAARAKKGTTCPTCEGHAQVYDRQFYRAHAKFLIWLAEMWNSTPQAQRADIWFNKNDYPGNIPNGEYGRVKQWKLAVLKPNNIDPKKTKSALWRPTERGLDFVRHRLAVPRVLTVFQNIVREESDELTCIRKALKKEFDVREISHSSKFRDIPGACDICG